MDAITKMINNNNILTVNVRGVCGLGSLLGYIAKNKINGFFDGGRPCFLLEVGVSDDNYDRYAAASLVSVTKKNGSIFAQINIMAYIDHNTIPCTGAYRQDVINDTKN